MKLIRPFSDTLHSLCNVVFVALPVPVLQHNATTVISSMEYTTKVDGNMFYNPNLQIKYIS